MSPAVAVAVITWVAIVILYLGLAAVLREVRMLRDQVTRLAATTAVLDQGASPASRSAQPVMPVVTDGGHPAVVLAADSTCPLCRSTIARLAVVSQGWPEPPVLLTYESPAEWGPLPPGLRVVRDDDAWSQIAHLSPPVLLQVDGDGQVTDLVLPANDGDVDSALSRWGLPGSPSQKVTTA